MNLFLDTNILFDVLAKRDPFYVDSAAAWSLVETGRLQGFISVISFNNVYYVMRRTTGVSAADKAIRLLRDVFQMVSLDARVMNQSIDSGFSDFEDAIQYFSAIHANASILLSRNVDDFPRDGLPVLTPAEFLAEQSLG